MRLTARRPAWPHDTNADQAAYECHVDPDEFQIQNELYLDLSGPTAPTEIAPKVDLKYGFRGTHRNSLSGLGIVRF